MLPHTPLPTQGLLPRPRLLALLGRALEVPLTLLAAPAGSGKTALLAQLLAALGPERAVLVAPAEDGPAAFVAALVAALQPAVPGCGQTALALAAGSAPPRAVLAALLAELSSVRAPLLLALDDYHQHDSPAVGALVAALLERLPSALHLLLATRADPPLPLARLRARGQLLELRAADLRFSADEAAALLRAAVGTDLPEAAAALAERTEGWAAGLQLAALALRGHPDPAAFVAAFDGSHRFVADFLLAEVLDRQPSHLRAFLLQTSVLERMCIALCDAVVGAGEENQEPRTKNQAPQPGTQNSKLKTQTSPLELLERENLFLVPLDERRGWFRYQMLFGELLRARLLREAGAAAVAELHRRAARWFDGADLPDEALGHALAAGDADLAAVVVGRRAAGLVERGDLLPLGRWVARMPHALLASRPPLALAAALLRIASGDLEQVAPLLHAAEQAPPDGPDAPGWLDRPHAVAQLLRASLARAQGQAEPARTLLRAALEGAPGREPFLRVWLLWELGAVEQRAGDLTAARAALLELLERAPPDVQGLWVQAQISLFRIALIQGDLRGAQRRCEEALRTLHGQRSGRGVGLLHLGLAAALYERGELDAAGRALAPALDLGLEPPSALLLALGSTLAALLAWARGDRLLAKGELRRVRALLPGLRAPFFLDMLLEHGYVRACVVQGEREALADLLDTPGLDDAGRRLALARLLLRDAPTEALALVDDLLAESEAAGANGRAVELLILRALARQALGDQASAVAALASALERGVPAGYLRRFADEGTPLVPLLARCLAEGALAEAIRPAAARIQALLGPAEPLAEPLTARELQVLRLLAQGAPNRTIAAALVIEPGTVKRHLHSIFGKLGVANRTQAVARAREIGLLEG
ncbi:MAG TPA: LuxR C-terminal-related transcriptional regulator [Roseiflexaceae bacterium]|nr:LuxR C-terminal-related transcriptional regulator [Roseiflexaceae bacterium]